MERMKRLIAIGCAALAAATCAFGRDTAIYNGKLTSDLNANGNAVTSLKEPSADSDAATKKYVDAATADAGKVQSVNGKTGEVVLAASDVGVWLTNGVITIDGERIEPLTSFAESDPHVGLTNGTIYVHGATVTPLTSHQSLADYAKTTDVNAAAAALFAYTTGVSNEVEAAQSSLTSLSTKVDNNTKVLNAKANAADVYKKSETYTQEEINAEIANATPSDYESVKEKANSALQSESDPAFNDWRTNKVITIGAGATVYEDGVSIGPDTVGVKGTLSTSYSASDILIGSKKAADGSFEGDSLQSLLNAKYSASDGASLANRVTSAESSIKTINSAGYVTQTTADSAYYPKASGDAWSSYWDGDDVRVTVTNYDSVAHLPSLYLEQRTNSTASASSDTNAFRVVWRELAHWDAFLGSTWNWEDATWQGFDEWRTSLSSQLDDKADRAWGFYDSHTGKYAPDGYTSISSSNVMICAGASYQKTATATCDVWVLTANEPYEPTGVSTNGGFQIKDADGNVQFEIVKGDKRTVKAQANATSVENNTTLVVTYAIVADSAPTGEVCLDLKSAAWKSETDSDCPATVTWSGSSGAWVARITPKSSSSTCFFKATYQVGGDTYVNNRCAVGMSQLVLDGTTYNLGTATIDGHTVLTLTPAN